VTLSRKKRLQVENRPTTASHFTLLDGLLARRCSTRSLWTDVAALSVAVAALAVVVASAVGFTPLLAFVKMMKTASRTGLGV
jgi:hypothetical protein